jgi:glycolate oxidase
MPDTGDRTFDLCAFCPDLCLDRCPAATVSGSNVVSPQAKMLQGWLLARGLAEPSEDMARAVHACMGCLACHEACKYHVDVETGLFGLRERMVRARVSPFPQSLFDVPTRDLVEAQDAVVPAGMFVPEAQAVLFPGCDALQKGPATLAALLSVFRRLGIEFVGASRDAAICCGYPLHAGGYAEAFSERARRVTAVLRRYRMVVVVSPCCAYTMRSLYLAAGVAVPPRVVLALDLIAPLVLRARREALGLKLAYHDSCHLGRHLGQYDLPREVLAHVNGGPVIELRRSRASSQCCGAGGGYDVTSPADAKAVARSTLDLAADAGADVVATAGMPCAAHLAGAATRKGPAVTDVVTLVDRWLAGPERA